MTATESATAIRYVVFHTPGPAWLEGVDFRDQPGVGAHVIHYRKLLEQGRLALGGPYLVQDAGGMMVTVPGLDLEDVEAFAAADPAVHSGLLKYEIRPWYTAMEK